MTKIQKAAYKSPLLGAIFLTVWSLFYIAIFILSLQDGLVNNISAVFKIIPILFILFSTISYVVSLPIGFFIYKEMQRNLRTENFFVNISLLIGFIISILFSIVDYSVHHILAKSFFIVIGFSLMAIINANYFLILAEIIKIKEKKNENTKGTGI